MNSPAAAVSATRGSSAGRSAWIAIGFFLLVLITFAWFFIPAYIIQPFTYQSPRGLVVAMAIKQYAPWASILTAGTALLFAFLLWSRARWWGKALLVLGICLVSASVYMARVDYFEWMFHPVAAPGFATIPQTKLDDSEMVMAVSFNGDARAYPIREMAYHHIVNDTVGGIPIEVTY
jgi:hypothetical protein